MNPFNQNEVFQQGLEVLRTGPPLGFSIPQYNYTKNEKSVCVCVHMRTCVCACAYMYTCIFVHVYLCTYMMWLFFGCICAAQNVHHYEKDTKLPSTAVYSACISYFAFSSFYTQKRSTTTTFTRMYTTALNTLSLTMHHINPPSQYAYPNLPWCRWSSTVWSSADKGGRPAAFPCRWNIGTLPPGSVEKNKKRWNCIRNHVCTSVLPCFVFKYLLIFLSFVHLFIYHWFDILYLYWVSACCMFFFKL